jgi:hypothetical protein
MTHHLQITFASIVASAAILLTAYHGSLDWMLLLVFAAMFLPGWKGILKQWLNKSDHCDPPEPKP